jgi:adenylate cyclase
VSETPSDSGLSKADAAARAGVDVSFIDSLWEANILPRAGGDLTLGDVRRIALVDSMYRAGLPLDGIAAGLQQGLLTLDFVDQPEYRRFALLSGETFEDVSRRTGVPFDLLSLIREAAGLGTARPDDRMREDELRVVPFVETQVRMRFDPIAVERLLRAWGDSTRRIAEAEAEWWRSQVTEPRLEAGELGAAISSPELSSRLSEVEQDALIAIYNANQHQTWTQNILQGFEYLLAGAGLYQAPARPPAICFLDITGYTRLTQERGDRAAANLAENLARLVKRSSVAHGGRPVKWLGDGVMFWFRDPGPGVVAALEMVDGVREAGLPPAHVGLHAGPVIVQEGDYYGQTVNMASRIAEYARPGEVLVSQSVAEVAGATDGVSLTPIGEVELKGVAGATQLFVARPS